MRPKYRRRSSIIFYDEPITFKQPSAVLFLGRHVLGITIMLGVCFCNGCIAFATSRTSAGSTMKAAAPPLFISWPFAGWPGSCFCSASLPRLVRFKTPFETNPNIAFCYHLSCPDSGVLLYRKKLVKHMRRCAR